MARAFRFRLEVLRRLREQAQAGQRRKVADAVRAVSQTQGRIEEFTNELQNAAEATRAARQAERIDVVFLRQDQFYRGWLQRRITESAVEMAQRRRELEKERDRLAEATKRLKVIAKLRERQWQRHRVKVQREEQAVTDEAATQSYSRRRHAQCAGEPARP